LVGDADVGGDVLGQGPEPGAEDDPDPRRLRPPGPDGGGGLLDLVVEGHCGRGFVFAGPIGRICLMGPMGPTLTLPTQFRRRPWQSTFPPSTTTPRPSTRRPAPPTRSSPR